MEDLKSDDPESLGRYRLISRLGAGGMGVVYLAQSPDGRRVAVKLIRSELADDPEFRARFTREVEAGRRVGGLCTAKYIDADLECDRPYLVTAYVEGGSLADYVAENGPLVSEQLIGMAVGLAEAVVAMRAAGVVHRDLKPSNVLMAPDGPKVVDFGISHALDGTALTKSGLIIGSPGWMAPEQAIGREATVAADVFAWGSTIAFAATGRNPFGEGRPEAVLYRVVHEDPDLEGIDAKLMPIVAGTLAKDPVARPAPDKLLVSVVRNAMPDAPPPGGSIAMATVVLDQTWRAKVEPAPSSSPPSPRARQAAWLSAIAVLVVGLVAGIVYAVNRGPVKQASHQPASHTATTGSTTTISPSTTSTGSSNITSGLVLRSGQGYTIELPATWLLTDESSPSDHSTIMWSDPADPMSRVEIIGSGCVGCVKNLDTGQIDPSGSLPSGVVGSAPITNCVLSYSANFGGDYTLNPTVNDTYLDNGLVVVSLSSTGSVNGYSRVDLWLPDSDHLMATKILNSFIDGQRNFNTTC